MHQQKLFSHRKHCSWNASSLAPPLILWLCDITLRHHVTHLHYWCLAASLARKNWFGTATLLLWAVPGQACVSWPIRGHCELWPLVSSFFVKRYFKTKFRRFIMFSERLFRQLFPVWVVQLRVKSLMNHHQWRCDGVTPQPQHTLYKLSPHTHTHSGRAYLLHASAAGAGERHSVSAVVVGRHGRHAVVLVHVKRDALDGRGAP